jgi:hypothetical protein
MAVLIIAADNGGGGGSHNLTGVTDSLGNTWTLRQSPLYDPGSAGAGVQGVIATTNQDAGTLTTGTVITVTFGNTSSPARAWTLQEIVGSAGVPTFVTGANGTGAATNAPTITTGSIASGRCVVGALFNERGTDQTITGDGDTSNGNWSTQQTAEIGSTTSGVSVSSQRKIVTGTGTQTYNPTMGVSSDVILAWIEIQEVVSNNYTLTADGFSLTLSGGTNTGVKGRTLVADGLVLELVTGASVDALQESGAGTAGNTIQSRAADSAHTWSVALGSGSLILTAGGRIRLSSVDSVLYVSDLDPFADGSMFADYVRLSAQDNRYQLFIRFNGSTDLVSVECNPDEGRWNLKEYVGGTPTVLDFGVLDNSDGTQRVELRGSGSTVSVWVDGVEVASATTSVTASGTCGMFPSTVDTPGDLVGWQLDNISAPIDAYAPGAGTGAATLLHGRLLDAAALALTLAGGDAALLTGRTLVAAGLSLSLATQRQPISSWAFDDASTPSLDGTANGNSLNWFDGSPAKDTTPGKFRAGTGSLALPTSADAVSRAFASVSANMPFKAATGEFSIGGWVYLVGNAATNNGFSFSNFSNEGIRIGTIATGKLRAIVYGNVTADLSSNGTIAASGLHHVMVRWNGNNVSGAGSNDEVSIWVDGVKQTATATLTSVNLVTASTLRFAGAATGITNFDEWLVYDKALLDTEIVDICAAGPGNGAAAMLRGRVLGAVGLALSLAGGDSTGTEGGGLNNYTLTADGMSLTLSAAAASLLYGRLLSGDGLTLSLAGGDSGLLHGRRLSAESLTLSLAGGAVSLLFGRRLTADGLALTLAGGDAAMSKGRILVAEGLTLALSLAAAEVLHGWRLTGDGLTLSLVSGDAALLRGRRLTAEGGTFGASVAVASLLNNQRLVADGVSFTLSLGAASLLLGRKLNADGGSFTLAGGDATLTYEPAGAYTLPGQGVTITFSGGVASLLHGRHLTADGVSLALVGGDAALLRGRRLDGEGLALTVTPADAALLRSRLLIAEGLEVDSTGGAAELTYSGEENAYTLVADGCTLVIVVADIGFIYSQAVFGNPTYIAPYPRGFSTLAECNNELRRLTLAGQDRLVLKDLEAMNALGWMRYIVTAWKRELIAAGVTE